MGSGSDRAIPEKLSYAAALEHAAVAETSTAADPTGGQSQAGDEIDWDLVAYITYMGRYDAIHPTVPTPGEQLPEGYSRSGGGFLLCNIPLEVKVDQEVVRKETERLKKYAIIAHFEGERQSTTALTQWVAALQTEVGDRVELGRDLGKGYFNILTHHPSTTQKLLVLTPHRSRWGTCILQKWTPGFVTCTL